jgi:predicted GNAT superfamily acetyltransferase
MGIDQRRAGGPSTRPGVPKVTDATSMQAEPGVSDLAFGSVVEHGGIVYRRPDAAAGEHHQLEGLQGDIWDPEVVTPTHQLIAAESCGGIILTAFDGGDAVGFSYAFPARRLGQVWLHSHQTGVQEASRDRGVGATLKWLQRWLALQEGYTLISWTFDPLQSRNAYFNFCKLGVMARTYKVDYYGRLPDLSNRDLPTDRLWIEWQIDAPRVAERFSAYRASSGIRWEPLPPSGPAAARLRSDGPVVNGSLPPRRAQVVPTRAKDGVRVPAGSPSLDSAQPTLYLEVPADLERIRLRQGAASAAAWRMAVREGFTAAFERGYAATGFVTRPNRGDRRSWYVLTRPDV